VLDDAAASIRESLAQTTRGAPRDEIRQIILQADRIKEEHREGRMPLTKQIIDDKFDQQLHGRRVRSVRLSALREEEEEVAEQCVTFTPAAKFTPAAEISEPAEVK
jgi:hypothetical protein